MSELANCFWFSILVVMFCITIIPLVFFFCNWNTSVFSIMVFCRTSLASIIRLRVLGIQRNKEAGKEGDQRHGRNWREGFMWVPRGGEPGIFWRGQWERELLWIGVGEQERGKWGREEVIRSIIGENSRFVAIISQIHTGMLKTRMLSNYPRKTVVGSLWWIVKRC